MDKIDLKIIELMQQKGRITNALLAEKIGLSPAPTLERVRKLERMGVIASYHALVDAKKVGLNVVIFIGIKLDYHTKNAIEQFKTRMDALPEVTEAYHTTGESDFLLKVYAKDIESYQKFIVEKLSQLEGISQIRSNVVMSETKQSHLLPVVN